MALVPYGCRDWGPHHVGDLGYICVLRAFSAFASVTGISGFDV